MFCGIVISGRYGGIWLPNSSSCGGLGGPSEPLQSGGILFEELLKTSKKIH